MAKEKDDSYKAPHNDTYYVGAESRSDDAGSFKNVGQKAGNKPVEPTLDNVSVDEVNAADLEKQKKGVYTRKNQKPGETTNSSQMNS